MKKILSNLGGSKLMESKTDDKESASNESVSFEDEDDEEDEAKI